MLALFLIALTLVASAAAQPVPDLAFGFDNIWPTLAFGIVTSFYVVWSPVSYWGAASGMQALTPNARATIETGMASAALGGLFTISPYITLAVSLLIRAYATVIFPAYVLKRFYDDANANVAIPDGTWATVIFGLAFGYLMARKVAEEWYGMLSWFAGAFFFSLLPLLASGAAAVFELIEIFQLPDAVVVIWNWLFFVVHVLFFLHSIYSTIFYYNAWSIMSPLTTSTGRKGV